MVLIVAYITLKLQLDIKLAHILDKLKIYVMSHDLYVKKTIVSCSVIHEHNKHLPFSVATLTLGSNQGKGLARLQAKKEAQESHRMLPRV